MADNSVFITGVADGAFEKAFSGLPDWATESTLVRIAKNLNKSMPIQTQALRDIVRELKGRGKSGAGGPGGAGAMGDPKSESALKKYFKTLEEGNKAADKKKKSDKEREEWDKKQLLGVKEFTSKWDVLSRGLTFAKAIGDKVLAVDSQYLKTMENLSDSGVSVYDATNKTKDGMEVLNQVVNLTGIRLENLEAAAAKYTDTMSAVSFQKYAKAVGNATKSMGNLGFNSIQTADMMGAYISMESSYTDMRGKSATELATELETFGKGVRDNMQAFGKSKEEILGNAKALSKSTDAFTSNAILGTEATKHATASLMGMPEDIAQGLMKSSALAGQGLQVGFDNIVNDFASSGSRFTTQMNSLVKALPNESPEQIRARFESMTKSPMWQQEIQNQQRLAVTGDAHAASALRTMQSIQGMVDTTSQATKAQKDAATGSASTVATLRTEQEKLAASTQAAFYPAETQIKAVTTGLELLNKAIYGVIDTINPHTRSNMGGGAVAAGGIASAVLTGLGVYGTGKTITGLYSKFAGKAAGAAEGAGAEGAVGAAGLGARGLGLGARVMAGLATLAVGAVAAAGDYGLGKMGVGKNKNGDDIKVNKEQDDKNWERMTLVEKMQSGLARGIEKAGDIVFLGNMSRQAESDRIRDETTYLNKQGTAPQQTTINSPSAVSSNPKSDSSDNSAPSPDTNQPSASGMDRAGSSSSINTLMMQQNNLTQQVLEKLDKIHKDNDTLISLTRTRT